MDNNIIKINALTNGEIAESNKYNKSGGGGHMDNNDYVTHKELNEALDKTLDKINKRFDQLDNRFDQMNKQFEKVDIEINDLNNKFYNLDKKIDVGFEQINTKFERVDTKFANQKVWFFATAISIISITSAIVGLLINLIK